MRIIGNIQLTFIVDCQTSTRWGNRKERPFEENYRQCARSCPSRVVLLDRALSDLLKPADGEVIATAVLRAAPHAWLLSRISCFASGMSCC
ncbi:hypothetical protein NOI87_34910, partial [Neorhizobium galegae]|uniref:hypothetical protein n=1 Tax=Neorhizobium galegae TaxID=399 RepID=UPI0021077EB5